MTLSLTCMAATPLTLHDTSMTMSLACMAATHSQYRQLPRHLGGEGSQSPCGRPCAPGAQPGHACARQVTPATQQVAHAPVRSRRSSRRPVRAPRLATPADEYTPALHHTSHALFLVLLLCISKFIQCVTKKTFSLCTVKKTKYLLW